MIRPLRPFDRLDASFRQNSIQSGSNILNILQVSPVTIESILEIIKGGGMYNVLGQTIPSVDNSNTKEITSLFRTAPNRKQPFAAFTVVY
jgi:hypothetical protein